MNKISAVDSETRRKVDITWSSLLTYLAFTALGTIVGEYIYQAYVVPKESTLETDTQDFLDKL